MGIEKKYRVAQLGDEQVYQVQEWGPLPRSFWEWVTGQPKATGWSLHNTFHCGYDHCFAHPSEWSGPNAYINACQMRDKLETEERVAIERTLRFEANLWKDADKRC